MEMDLLALFWIISFEELFLKISFCLGEVFLVLLLYWFAVLLFKLEMCAGFEFLDDMDMQNVGC